MPRRSRGRVMMPDELSREVNETDRASTEFAKVVRKHFAYRDDDEVLNENTFRSDHFFGLAGGIPAMWEAVRQAEAISKHTWPVVIEGPAGSDKEGLCRAIHEASALSKSRLLHCSCAGLEVLTLRKRVQRGGKAPGLMLTQFDRASKEVQDAVLGILCEKAADGPCRVYVLCDRVLFEPPSDNFWSEKPGDALIDRALIQTLGYKRRLIIPPIAKHRWDIMPTVLSILLSNERLTKIRSISYAAAIFLTEREWEGDIVEVRETVSEVLQGVASQGGSVLTLKAIDDHFRDISGTTARENVQEAVKHLDSQREYRLAAGYGLIVGSETCGEFHTAMHRSDRFRYPREEQERENWKAFQKKNGFMPVLFAPTDVPKYVHVLELEHEQFRLNHGWFGRLPKGRWTWKRSIDPDGEHGVTFPEVTLKDADEVFLFDVRHMASDLWPYLNSGEATKPVTSKTEPIKSPTPSVGYNAPFRWMIYDACVYLLERGIDEPKESVYRRVAARLSAKDRGRTPRTVKDIYLKLSHEAKTGNRPTKYPPTATETLERLFSEPSYSNLVKE